jgi:hypothetical protein
MFDDPHRQAKPPFEVTTEWPTPYESAAPLWVMPTQFSASMQETSASVNRLPMFIPEDQVTPES